MKYGTPKDKPVYIVTRDINGKRTEWEFESEGEFVGFADEYEDCFLTENDEILIVKYDGDVIYCSLTDDLGIICADDLTGFFA